MKPDDIPEDVLAAAEAAYHASIVMTTRDEPKAIVLTIARAILAERARCAKIALSYEGDLTLRAADENLSRLDYYDTGVTDACNTIAAAINQSSAG